MIRSLHRSLLLLFVLLFATDAWASPPPPTPQEHVTDGAGVMSPAERDDLDSRLVAYEEQSGHQVVVWIGRTSGDDSIEDFAVNAFESWKVGRAGHDDGIALFVLVDDRKVRIEVGYGLEDRVTDVVASRIIRDVVVPHIVSTDFDGAIRSGVEAIVDEIEGRPEALPAGALQIRGPPQEDEDAGWGSAIVMGVVGLAFLILLFTRPQLALFMVASLLGRGGRRVGGGGGFSGGGGGGGGGFSGGGGRSGGGGASGGW